MGIRDEQREKRKQEILETALDLFIRKGYASTKISDIAQSVGMSVGLLFHYFESKEKLYENLIQYGVSGPMKTMVPTDDEPLKFFEDTAEKIIRNIHSQPFIPKMFVLMNQAFYNEAAPQNVKDLLQDLDIYTPTFLLMKEGQANGTIREGNPEALGIAYWCAIQGIAEQAVVNPNMPCPESAWIVDIIRRKK
jgi:AcrR family transcriptional regulator